MNRLLSLLALSLLFACAPVWAQDDNGQIESQVPGDAQIVRWDMLLNQNGADAVNKVATPAKSNSKIYQAMTANGFELRQAMADAITNQGVEGAGSQMAYAQSNGSDSLTIQNLYFNYYNYNNQQSAVGLNGSFQTTDIISRGPGDHIHLSLNDKLGFAQVMERQRWTSTQIPATIRYQGDLAPGDAVAFLAPITYPSKTVYYQLTVFENFKAYAPLMQWMQAEQSTRWWCVNGPAGLRKWAGAAAVWESQAAHPGKDVPVDFIQKLSDGKELCLLAFSRPTDAPWCWWDAHGKPISITQSWGLDGDGEPSKGLCAMVELRGTARDYQLDSPATRPINDPNANISQAQPYITDGFTTVADGAGEIKAGAAVGPWQEVAQMNSGDEKQVDGINYKIDNQQAQGSTGIYANIRRTGDGDNVVAITAVGSDGLEAVNRYDNIQSVDFDHHVIRPGDQFGNGAFFSGIALSDLQYYRLCKRTRQYVTFSRFAAAPQSPVNTVFTPQDLAAAMKHVQDLLDQQQHENALAAVKAQQERHKRWEAIPADPATPMGALRVLINAANSGDEKAVRAMFISTSPNDDATLDAMAHCLTLIQSNWKRAVERFGEEKLMAVQNTGIMLIDYSQNLQQITWKKNDDGTWESDEMTLRKNDAGKYQLDMGKQAADKDFIDGLNSMRVSQERLAKALDKPDVTIEQLQAAGQEQGK